MGELTAEVLGVQYPLTPQSHPCTDVESLFPFDCVLFAGVSILKSIFILQNVYSLAICTEIQETTTDFKTRQLLLKHQKAKYHQFIISSAFDCKLIYFFSSLKQRRLLFFPISSTFDIWRVYAFLHLWRLAWELNTIKYKFVRLNSI